LTHPISREKVLYANPGYAMKINELSPEESDEILDYLFELQMQDKYLYTYQWQKDSLLMWDNIGTMHNAVADYCPNEHRYIRRCQIMATRFYGSQGTSDPIFFKAA
jgi:taurine dioxygenase